MSGGSGRRILIVEDEVHVTNLLRIYLENAGYEVHGCADGRLALQMVRDLRPDLVILDLMLPGWDGLTVCRRLREERDIPVIMLTARTTEGDRLQGLREGADDYVTKPFSPAEVVLRVEAVLRRARRADPPSARIQVGPVALDLEGHRCVVNGQEVDLTPTEFRLLHVLMGSAGRTFTRQELLDRVAGPDFSGFDRNVDVHVANIRRKLALQPSPVRTVYGVGYRYQADKRS